jgi:phosphatidylserine/phosphatidylglycerophosphate/cardiolipin synthase-like enzyme
MHPVEAYLPCEVFPVQARFGFSDTLSTLEMLLLRAIHLGEHHVVQLAAMFGLSDKMLRDVLMGLWRAGHLIFTSPDKKIYLSSSTAKKVEESKWEEIERAPSGSEEINLMFDLVTGRVLTVAGRITPPNAAAIIPYTPNTIKLENLSYDAIVASLEMARRISNKQDTGARVLSASIAFNRSANGQRMRWRKLEVTCHRITDGKHEVRVVNTGAVPFGLRRDLGEYLTRQIDEEHEGTDKHFFDKLRNSAMLQTPTRSGLGIELDNLLTAARALASCRSDEALERHQFITDQARDVALAVAEEISSVAQLTPIIGLESHEKILADLIKRATEQVVIACPFVSGTGLARIQSSLKQAIGNGARVIILWGISRLSEDGKEPYDLLEQQVKNIVEDLSTLHPTKFFFSHRATGTHAKVLVCDDSVLVTSLNILRPSRDGVTEVGILAQSLEELGADQPLPIAADVLTWAREIVPDSTIADAITVKQKRLVKVPAPPSAPRIREDESPEQRRSELAVWAGRWVVYVEELAHMRGLRPTVRLVRDGEHRGLLDLAISETNKRLIVTSDQISTDAFRSSTRQSLLELGKKNASVRLIYRDPLRKKIREGAAAEQLLLETEQLAKNEGYDIQCARTNNHSKVLVFDDMAVVSSFNFLSHSGQYGGSRSSRIAELGLLLSGPGVADSVVSGLAQTFAIVRTMVTTAEVSVAAPAILDARISTILEALESETKEALQDAFVSAVEPWNLLESIMGISAIAKDSSVLRRLVAGCMANGRDSNPIEFKKWALFLAREAWLRNDVIEAYLLRASMLEEPSNDPAMPHLGIVEAAAKRLAGCSVQDWSGLGIEVDHLPLNQRAALAVLALAEAVEQGSKDAAEFAYLICLTSLDFPASWRSFSENVMKYVSVAFEHFPHETLNAASQQKQERKFEREFKALQNALEHHATRQFRSKTAGKIWTHLFGQSGRFAQLLHIARQRDTAGMHNWFDSLDNRAPAEILQTAIHEVFRNNDETIERDKLETVENSIRNIMEVAAVVERISTKTRYDHTDQVIAAARQLCAELKQSWPALSSEASSTFDPVVHPITNETLNYFESLIAYSAQ